jgi:hypothetical protein
MSKGKEGVMRVDRLAIATAALFALMLISTAASAA